MDLNGILGIRDGGYNVYTSRSRLDFSWYFHTRAVKNICRRSDFSNEDYSGTLKSQALCLQVRMLYNVLQHVISPKKGHGDKVTRLDVALLDSIIEEMTVNVGYVILHHMLATLEVGNKTLPFGGIITRILKHFKVPPC